MKAIDLASLNYYRRRYPDRSFEERKDIMQRDLAAFYDTYGWVKFKQGEYENALQLIRKAVGFVGKESASPEILEHLAQTYEKVDSLDEAISVYTEILKRDPQAEKVREEALETFLKRGGTEEEFDSILSTFSSTSSGEGSSAPDFTVNDMEDKEVKLSDFRGKVVVINFWATWCPPCIREIPLLNQLVDSFKKNPKVVFLAISGEKKDRIERFLKSNEFKYNVCYGGMKVSRDYKVMYIPTHIIIDPEGQIYSKHVGFVEGIDKLLEKELKEIIGESGE